MDTVHLIYKYTKPVTIAGNTKTAVIGGKKDYFIVLFVCS